jgi:selenocysteine-specific elongation factor
MAHARLLGGDELHPGETGWLQLDLQEPITAIRGDRFILRRPSPPETLGGGLVVDAFPKERHKPHDMEVVQRLETLLHGTPADRLLEASQGLGPAPIRQAIARSHLQAEAAAAAEELISTGQWVRLDELPLFPEGQALVIPHQNWAAMKKTILESVAAYHEAYPLRQGMPREELKSRLKLAPQAFQAVLRKLAAEGDLAESSKFTALPGHRVQFSPYQQVKADRLMEQFAASPYSPPSIKECQAAAGEDVFNALLEFGDLISLSEEVVFRKEDYEHMVEQVREHFKDKAQFTLAQVRDLFHTSRRYAQAFLEHLDETGLTMRTGDHRRLTK